MGAPQRLFLEDKTMSKRETYEQALERLRSETMTDTVLFKLTKTNPSIFESKVGGTPYIPRDRELPNDGDGNQLRFLAQIDCESLKTLPDFPHRGLLQFFISESDILGLDEDDGFKVFYYEEADKTVTEEECKAKIKPLNEPDERYMPVEGEYGMEFKPEKMSMTMVDYRYNDLARSKLEDEVDEDLFDEIFYNYDEDDDECECDDDGYCEHRSGGYPYFTQYDPRDEESEHTVLLFQLDSDYGGGEERVMWGDSGICNFFIRPGDLKNRDFTNVLYNWDCC